MEKKKFDWSLAFTLTKISIGVGSPSTIFSFYFITCGIICNAFKDMARNTRRHLRVV